MALWSKNPTVPRPNVTKRDAATPLSASTSDAVLRSRRLLKRRALVAAAAAAVPVPGLDWAVDAALLSRLIPAINRECGLAPEQIDRLDPSRRDKAEKAVAMVGSVLIGKFVTRDLVLKAAKVMGMRLTAQQAAKFVPIAGQAASALMGYLAIRYFGEMHIKDCVRAAEELQVP